MAYRKIGTGWDENMRADIDTMFIELYREYTQAGLDAAEAREKALKALEDALTAKEISETTREEMLAIIREQTQNGDLAPEIAQARQGKATLGDNLNSIKTNLAQKADESEVRKKEVKLELEDMSETTLAAIQGGEGTTFNLLSEPQDNSVTPAKLSSSLFADFEGIRVIQRSATTQYLRLELVFDTNGLTLTESPITVKFGIYSENPLISNVGTLLFLNNRHQDLSTAISYTNTHLQEFKQGQINHYSVTRDTYVTGNRYVHLFVHLDPNTNTEDIEYFLSDVEISIDGQKLTNMNIYRGYNATSVNYEDVKGLPGQIVSKQDFIILEDRVNNMSTATRLKTYNKVGGEGDSNMYGLADDGSGRLPNPYLNQIGDYFGASEVLNYGVSGCNVSTHDNRNPLVNRLDAIDKTCDLFFLEGGFNDYWTRTPVGTMSSRDTSNFYGALHEYYGYIARNLPLADKVVIGVWQSRIGAEFGGASRSDGVTMRDWADIQREVAEYYSMRFFDAYSELGISHNLQEHIDLFMKDGLHQSQLGADISAKRLIGVVNSI